MISTVTTSTVSTVTTVALGGSIALVAILVLLAMLVQKELTTASTDHRMYRLGRSLMIGIVPLLIAFAMIVISRVADVLR